MSNREQVQRIIDAMPEYRITGLLAFLRAFEEQPNEETREAIEDVRNRRNLLGPFDTVEELMEVLNAED